MPYTFVGRGQLPKEEYLANNNDCCFSHVVGKRGQESTHVLLPKDKRPEHCGYHVVEIGKSTAPRPSRVVG